MELLAYTTIVLLVIIINDYGEILNYLVRFESFEIRKSFVFFFCEFFSEIFRRNLLCVKTLEYMAK